MNADRSQQRKAEEEGSRKHESTKRKKQGRGMGQIESDWFSRTNEAERQGAETPRRKEEGSNDG
jgi:hypothetical protein